jgi:hypothetical protein
MTDNHHHYLVVLLMAVVQSDFNCSNLVAFVFFKQLLNNHRNQFSLAGSQPLLKGSSKYLRSSKSYIMTDNHYHHQVVLVVVVQLHFNCLTIRKCMVDCTNRSTASFTADFLNHSIRKWAVDCIDRSTASFTAVLQLASLLVKTVQLSKKRSEPLTMPGEKIVR